MATTSEERSNKELLEHWLGDANANIRTGNGHIRIGSTLFRDIVQAALVCERGGWFDTKDSMPEMGQLVLIRTHVRGAEQRVYEEYKVAKVVEEINGHGVLWEEQTGGEWWDPMEVPYWQPFTDPKADTSSNTPESR